MKQISKLKSVLLTTVDVNVKLYDDVFFCYLTKKYLEAT